MYGWAGQRLKVYLTEGKVVKEPLPDDLRLNYLGGRGFNSKTLFDELRPGIDPLGPENIFMVAVGPLNGTAAPSSARWTVTAKSTVTGGIGDGNGGGDFGTELKFAGFDQVVFYGRSPKPVYLWVHDGSAELRDACHLWGKTTGETDSLIKKDLRDRDVRVLCIGPAGENLVRFGKVFSNITRAGGKGGTGAVMGSKNLKAVAVRGTGPVRIARPKEFLQAARHYTDKLRSSPYLKMLSEEGTMHLIRDLAAWHVLPTRNSRTGDFEGWENLSSQAFEAQFAVKHKGCSGCPISCSHYYRVPSGPYATHGESNEYGTTYPLGSKCGIDNLAAVLKMGTMCDQLGMDTHSCGGTICFAMDCWSRGLLRPQDTGGIDLSWGNIDSVMKLLPMIAYRQGFGNILAEGSFRASKRIEGSEVCRHTTKGMEVSALYIGPSTNITSALGYAVATRGADHLRGTLPAISSADHRLTEALGGAEAVRRVFTEPRDITNKAAYLALNEDFFAFVNTLEICTHLIGETRRQGLSSGDMAELFSTCTGVDMTGDELIKTGERIHNVEKAFNLREGLGRKDDTLPESCFVEEETPWGTKGLSEAKFQDALNDYYRFRGWNHEGIPTRQKLEELGIGYIAPQIGAE